MSLLARVDHVDEQPCALEMGEELVAQPHAPARPLQQTGHVGEHELRPGGVLDGAENG